MQDWVKNETANQVMSDARLSKRLGKILDSLSTNAQKSIPNANDTWAETVASYRFFDNDNVTFDKIMSGHKAATIERIKHQPVVLIPQDTTFLNFATEAEAKNMGTLRVKDSDQQLLHTSIAITPSRVNLGVVEGGMWKRPEKIKGAKRQIKPIHEKESIRWLDHYDAACRVQAACPETTVVSIADREGDIHEWFQHAEKTAEHKRAAYIVRAKANRTLELDDDETIALWDYVNSEKSIGKYSVDLPKRNGEPGRNAVLNVVASEVRLKGKGKARQPLFIYVVYAKEIDPPTGVKGLEWLLLTDLNVEDFNQARTVIEWYRCRWEIETYFRVIKGGCNIVDNRLRTDQRKLNCIAIYMIIGWRLHSVTMESRRQPEIPCSEVFSKKEWEMIWIMKTKTKPPSEPPSLRKITHLLAAMGGFLGRKGDGEPGVKTVWEGYFKLLHYLEATEILKGLDNCV